MNVLFLGCDKGAWQMRGRQIASVFPARYASKPSPDVWDWADIIVLVKRGATRWADQARESGKRIVWDVLDVWQQPEENQCSEKELVRFIRGQAQAAGVTTLIGATQAMATAIGGVYLPHHCRLGLVPTPPRKRAQFVAYDGSPRYLGSWHDALQSACRALHVTFVINPSNLKDADVLVAFRGEAWDGRVCRQWKSGVKYVNAIAAGRPMVTQDGAAYREIRPFGRTIADQEQLVEWLQWALTREARDRAFELGRKRAGEFTLEAIADRYRDILAKSGRAA